MSDIDIADSDDELQEEPYGDILAELEHEPVETGDNQGEENQENEGEEDEEKKKVVKPKRIIRNPGVKFNAELLKGPKGFGVLEKCFEKVKFKGKGYEEEDLNVLLKTYEYWCHRLYPKFPFQSCVEKIEKLGSKGPIQTYLKKVRSGMVDEEIHPISEALPEFKSDDEEMQQTEPVAQSIIEDIPIELTPGQLETIRRNREKAEKLRLERLRKIQEKASINLPQSNLVVAAGSSTKINTEQERDICASSTSEAGGQEIIQKSVGYMIQINSGSDDEEFMPLSRKTTKRYLDNNEEEKSGNDEMLSRTTESETECHKNSSVKTIQHKLAGIDQFRDELVQPVEKLGKDLDVSMETHCDKKTILQSESRSSSDQIHCKNTSDVREIPVNSESMCCDIVEITEERVISISPNKQSNEKEEEMLQNPKENNKENERIENINPGNLINKMALLEGTEEQMNVD